MVENKKKIEQMSKSIIGCFNSLIEHKMYEISEMKVEKYDFKSLFGQFKIVVKVKWILKINIELRLIEK